MSNVEVVSGSEKKKLSGQRSVTRDENTSGSFSNSHNEQTLPPNQHCSTGQPEEVYSRRETIVNFHKERVERKALPLPKLQQVLCKSTLVFCVMLRFWIAIFD
jgi:hypothetical protein